ncbi:MAG: 1-acyl-sn-glycerol-3-phosphate acyltransferase [Holosporaceae bacterium]|nr:1-acyl-sn-glycerol-3-phosphate acyltransferase [Holosporaceae bacterium]
MLFNGVFFSTIAIALILGFPLIFLNNRKYVFIFWHYLSIILEFITAKISGIKCRVENEKNILKKPAIYAMRHESTWETLILISKFKEPIFVLKEELLKLPLFGAMAKKAGTISVDRKNKTKALRDAIDRVENSINKGHPVIIFPEGTRMAAGEYVPLKRGIALFYEKINCTVVPVVHNSGYFWPRRGFIKKPGTIIVRFMDPIVPGLSRDEFMDKLNDVFHTEIDKLREKKG